MKRTIVLILIVVVALAGIYLLTGKDFSSDQPGGVTNGEMLRTDSDLAISVESDVEYFEGARGYFARPEAPGNYPGIVMIHENRGLRPEIRGMAEQLAREGYLVLAVDLLGSVVETQEQARALTADFNQGKGVENMRSAVAFLRERGVTKIGSIGWCFGGAQSLRLALSGEEMAATVIYYGRLATTTTELSPISSSVLGIFGSEDQSISVESVSQFESALASLGIENEIYIYDGVGHAFANPSGMNYAPEETRDAWLKTVGFLNKHLR